MIGSRCLPFALFALQASLLADEWHGRNGERMRGRCLAVDDTGARFAIGQGECSFPWNQVSHLIWRQPPPADGPSEFLVRLIDGDEILGRISALDDASLSATTSFGASLSVPRSKVAKVLRFPIDGPPVYQGPNSADEWRVAHRGESWKFVHQDGQEPCLWASAQASSGREIAIPERAILEFDATLQHDPTLRVVFRANNAHDGGGRYWELQWNPSRLALLSENREDGRGLLPMALLSPPGAAQLRLLREPHARFRLFIDRPARSVAVEINGQPFASFRDVRAQAPAGGGVIFLTNGDGLIRLRDVRVTPWLGEIDWAARAGDDLLVLANGETRTGKAKLTAAEVEIAGERHPLASLRGLSLAAGQAPAEEDGLARVFVLPAGQLRLRLERGETNDLTGAHAILGKVAIPWSHLAGLNAPASADPAPSAPDWAIFGNGDHLRGEFAGWTPEAGPRWRLPGGEEVSLTNLPLKRVVLGPRKDETSPGSALVAVKGRDLLRGEIEAVDQTGLRLKTDFGGSLNVDLAAIDRVEVRRPSDLVFEASVDSLAGWTPSTPDAWQAEDGLLISRRAGGIGREMAFPERGLLELEVAWDFELTLSIAFLTKSLADPVSPPGYLLMGGDKLFTLHKGADPNEIAKQAAADPLRNRRLEEQLREFQAKFGRAPMTKLGGSRPVPYDGARRERRLAIGWSKVEKTIWLWVDGEQVGQWKDETGFTEMGRGLVLWRHGAMSVARLASLSVRHWNGAPPETPPKERGGQDLLRLRNQDELTGRLAEWKEGVVRFEGEFGPLRLPADRVSQITFAQRERAFPAREGMVVQGFFRLGGGCAFFLEKADAATLRAWSPYWGQTSLKTTAFRELHFNLRDRQLWTPGEPTPDPPPAEMRPFLPADGAPP